MKKIILVLVHACLFVSNISLSQSWQKLEEGKPLHLEGMDISYIISYIKTKKGQDVYELTATIANNGHDLIRLFPQARYDFIEEPQNAWAHFRFTNATGKGLSSREGYIYPQPIHMMFPYKCNPQQKKPTYKSRVIGLGLSSGQSRTNEWRVRVEQGKKPEVMVFVKSN